MKAAVIIKYVFTLVGAAMLVGASLWYLNTTRFLATAESAQGTVVDLKPSISGDSTTYRPVVRFTSRKGEPVDFTSSVGSNPPSYSRGDKVEVVYQPGSPQQARINGFFSLWGGPLILGAMSVIFLLTGAGFAVVPLLLRRRDEALRIEGTPIQTDFLSVDINTSYSVNDKHPYQIVTQWRNPATSEIHLFKSRNLWYDPTSFIKDKRITVYIARDNPKKYLVDVAFLPK